MDSISIVRISSSKIAIANPGVNQIHSFVISTLFSPTTRRRRRRKQILHLQDHVLNIYIYIYIKYICTHLFERAIVKYSTIDSYN